MTYPIPNESFRSVGLNSSATRGNTSPPRDPDDDEEDENDDEEDDDRNDPNEPAVVREPDED
ncbi:MULTISPECIES: hypothetical protein [unclassified Bradyrhizobium]|uniref:hypothetical protein n=1 Tax=unclassified Bradyrhizobium TaxID=2631580 RepID=UPI00247ACFAF|nr:MULTISPECIES: hypothetical protein [unclassified Bradyrhizobium]WGR68695.1 hypothetical protein MTX24_25090 [Bradyrhizobium sp. ISRA426]WGR80750.1 hypothetical protein MTX21_10205 [Bradyrhizobium sp. ISRA430]WGR83935.1 hypothetical protein MTX25_24770 [Bradyrhizobium sp. ISRA432]